MKKFILPALFAVIGLCGNEMQISGVNKNAEKILNYPIVERVTTSVSGDCNAVQVKDASGKIIPSQWDDLNGNGKIDQEDEISFLADLAPGGFSFTCRFIKSSEKIKVASAVKSPVVSIENSFVKVSQHRQKLLLRSFYLKQSKRWVPVAGAFVLEPRMDNSWKWKNSDFSVKVVSAGCVRQVLRVELVKKGIENDKTVKIINDLSVFSGRNEILSRLRFINTSPSQIVQINTVNAGMYQVMSDGKNPIGDLSFRTITQSGEVRTSSFLLKRPASDRTLWAEVSGENGGFAMILSPVNVQNFLIRSISGGKAVRMSVLWGFEKAVLWPGKSVETVNVFMPLWPAETSEKFVTINNNVKRVMQ